MSLYKTDSRYNSQQNKTSKLILQNKNCDTSTSVCEHSAFRITCFSYLLCFYPDIYCCLIFEFLTYNNIWHLQTSLFPQGCLTYVFSMSTIASVESKLTIMPKKGKYIKLNNMQTKGMLLLQKLRIFVKSPQFFLGRYIVVSSYVSYLKLTTHLIPSLPIRGTFYPFIETHISLNYYYQDF